MRLIENPTSPFLTYDCEYFEGMTPPAKLEVYADKSRSILSKNESPDLPFKWSLNPYRGCTHACIYCYARTTHEFLDFGAGSDFETKIMVKERAPELLREAFKKRSWCGELIVFSGDTDCYQPLEFKYELTKKCLEVCEEFGNPVSIITKSALIARDLELLKRLHERTHLNISISIPFADEKHARFVEPHAASLASRFHTLRRLADAGLQVGVNVAPIIPGFNDVEMPEILKKAKENGAAYANFIMLRLPGNVRGVFAQKLRDSVPLAAEKILSRIKQARGGKLNQAEFGERFSGTGKYWENIEQLFKLTCKRLKLDFEPRNPRRKPFRRPSAQIEMFEDVPVPLTLRRKSVRNSFSI